jgi:hypothetical protein
MARITFCAVTVLSLILPFSVIADEGHRQIYLLMGQSNMVGRGELTRWPPHPRVLSFNKSGNWIPAVDPLHEKSLRDRVGPGVSFGRGMLHVVDREVTLGLVPCAVGGSPLSRWEKGGDLYEATVRRAREAAKHGVLRGILWMQGEKDAKELALAKSYAKRLDAMILDLRREFGMPELPFVAALPCAELAERDDRPGAELVSESLRELPLRVQHTATVDSDGLKSTGDQTHFSTPSQRELGRRYAEAMATLLGYDDVEIPTELAAATEEQTRTRELSPFARKLLAASDDDLQRLSVGESQGLIELAPVNLPIAPKGHNNHFGWPVATMVDDTLIVVHRAMPGHNRKLSGDADADTTYSTIVRSTDGGQTWSVPYDVRLCMTVEDRNRGGSVPLSHRYKFDPDNHSPLGYKLHLNAIGTTRDGAVVLVSDHGAFRSEDKGRTWKHLQRAFREDRHDGPFVSVGPRIINHPEHGLLLFAHHTIYKNHRPHEIVRELAIYRSRDRGESWEKTRLTLPDWCKPAEPDIIFHADHFVAMVRNQAPANILAQMRFQFGDPTITDVANTNMKTRRSVDTSAICFNPITKRYEVVQSKREDMSINLFSIAPEDWKTAKWRFEGQLFKRTGSFYSTADGFHTGGAVIDEKRGVQHVFFYSGHPGGPAGVFRLTRTLDTPKLAEFLKPRNQPDKRDTVHWTGNAKTTSWKDSGNWDPGVPDQHDIVIFDGRAAGQSIQIDDVVRIGRLDLRLANKTGRLTLTGSGTLALHGAEYIRNKYSTALIQTGILDLGPDLNVEIRNQRFAAGNQDGTIVIRSVRVRAGEKEPTSKSYKSDGEHLKLSITDRGAIRLMTEHWELGMSLDMSASHTEGPKVIDFALDGGRQGVTFIRLKEHDGDPVEIRSFDDDDFFRFRADPLKSCDKGKEFRIDAVKFVGWPNNGKAAIEQHGEYWYLKPATASLPETLP